MHIMFLDEYGYGFFAQEVFYRHAVVAIHTHSGIVAIHTLGLLSLQTTVTDVVSDLVVVYKLS